MSTAADLNAHAIGQPNWTTAVIAVVDKDANPTLSTIAQVRGFFAVHRSLSMLDDADDWRLTHIPTGACFPITSGEEEMYELAEQITGMWDWSFTDPAMVKQAPLTVREAVFALKEAA